MTKGARSGTPCCELWVHTRLWALVQAIPLAGSVGNATRMGVRNNGSLDTEAGQICWLSLRPHPKTSPLLESARQ